MVVWKKRMLVFTVFNNYLHRLLLRTTHYFTNDEFDHDQYMKNELKVNDD